uniref:hypothetical protein n=1 Tax=Cupriavidus yeoncheonensis TaxID=1462994 RepID=UPI003F499703
MKRIIIVAILATIATAASAEWDGVVFTLPAQNGNDIELTMEPCPASYWKGAFMARTTLETGEDMWGCWNADNGKVRVAWRWRDGEVKTYTYPNSEFRVTPGGREWFRQRGRG